EMIEALKQNPQLIKQLAEDAWPEAANGTPMPTYAEIRKLKDAANKPKDMGPYTGVKQSKNIRVTDWKEVSIKPEALAAANKQLSQVKSFLRLVPVGDAVDGFIKVRPEWNGDRKVTATHAESHGPLAELNKAGQPYISWADCHRTAQSVM